MYYIINAYTDVQFNGIEVFHNKISMALDNCVTRVLLRKMIFTAHAIYMKTYYKNVRF